MTPIQKPARPSKIDAVRKALVRKRGATVEDIVKITGWNERTVARTIARLRAGGMSIDKASERRGTVYHAHTA